MNSLIEIDPTLPIDLDGSANPDFLPDVTGSHLEHADGSVPMVAKSNGRMSPIRARTMKEYDQHIAELKKENFSLKLRIYFLEERMQQKFGNEEDVFKTNIELKVEVESQKRELLDKHELIQKASNAMESLTSKHSHVLKNLASQYEGELKRLKEEIERGNQQDYLHVVDELKSAQDMIKELKIQLEEEIEKGKDWLQQIQELKPELEEKERVINHFNEDHNKLEDELSSLRAELEETKTESEKMSDMVAKLQMELGRKERDIHHLSSAFRDTSIVDCDSLLAPNHLQDVVDDQKDTISKLTKEKLNLQSQLTGKEDAVEKQEVLIQIMKDRIQELENKLKENEETLNAASEQNKVVSKVLRGLQSKNDQLNNELKKLKEEADSLKEEVHKLNMEKHEVEARRQEEREAGDRAAEQLTQTVHDHEQQLENLMRSLGKKDGELVNFRQLLTQVQDALKQSEVAVEILQEEKERAQDSTHKQEAHYKGLVSDLEKQLKNKEVLLQQMTERLDMKDKQLQDCMDLIKADKEDKQSTLDNLLKKMAERIKTKNNEIECLENENDEKNEIIRELKKKLQAAQRALTEKENLGDVPNDILNDMSKLKREIAQLKAQQNDKPVGRDSTANEAPELLKLLEEQLKEMRLVSESLKREHQIFITLNARAESGDKSSLSADHTTNFYSELGAVQNLRQQLEDNVLRNNSLWQRLQDQVTAAADADFVRLKKNHSPDVFDKGVVTSPHHHRNSDNVRYISSQTSPVGWTRSEIDTQTSPAGHKWSEISIQTSPVGRTWSEIHTQTSPRVQLRTSSDASLLQTVTVQGGSSHRRQQSDVFPQGSPHERQIPMLEPHPGFFSETDRCVIERKDGAVPDSDALAGMTATMLRKLVSQLQDDLMSALKQNHHLQQYVFSTHVQHDASETRDQSLDGGHAGDRNRSGDKLSFEDKFHSLPRDSFGDRSQSGVGLEQLKQQVSELKQFLDKKVTENHILRKSLALESDTELDYTTLPNVLNLQNELVTLRSQLNEVLHLNDLLKKQNSVDNSPSGNVEKFRSGQEESYDTLQGKHLSSITIASSQVSQFVSSIPRLRLTRSSDEVDASLQSNDDNLSVKPSRIPCLKSQSCDKNTQLVNSTSSHQPRPLIVEHQLHSKVEQLNSKVEQLKSKLSATEETVRFQTQKMKYYRKLLQDAGLGLLESRSLSELCLNKSTSKSFHTSLECLYPLKGDQSGVSVTANRSGLTSSLTPPPNFPIKRTSSHNSPQTCHMVEHGNKQKVKDLEEQLELSKYENHELQEKLNALQQSVDVMSQERENMRTTFLEKETVGMVTAVESVNGGVKSPGAEPNELMTLRRQLVDLDKANVKLRQQLKELSLFLSEMVDVHASEDEPLSNSMNSIQEYLNQSMDVLKYPQSEGSTAALHNKYCKALQQIQQLKEQQRHNQQQSRKEVGLMNMGPSEGPTLVLKRQIGCSGLMESDTDSLRSTSPSDGRPKHTSTGSTHPLTLTRTPVARENRSAELDVIVVYKQTDENYGRPITSPDSDKSIEQMRHRLASGNTTIGSHHLTGNLSTFHGNTTESDIVSRGPVAASNTDDGVLGGDGSRLYSSLYHSKFSRLYRTPLNVLDARRDDAADRADSVGTRSPSDTLSDGRSSRVESGEVKHLQSRLCAVENMNRTLKDELSIYETLCTSAIFDKSCGTTLPSGSFTGNDTLNLKEHLADIQALRLKLEKSLLDNEKLNEQLMIQQQSVAVHYDCEQRLRKLQEVIAGLQAELLQKDGSSCGAHHSRCETRLSELQEHIDRLHAEHRQRENTYSLRENQYENRIHELENSLQTMHVEHLQKNTWSVEQKQYKGQIHELENGLKTLHSELSERDMLASESQKQYEAIIGEMRERVRLLQEELARKEAEVTEFKKHTHSRLDEQQVVIRSLQGELAHQEKVITEKHNELAHQEKVITEKHNELAHQEKVIIEKHNELAHQEKVITEKHNELAHQQKVITEKQNELTQLEKVITEKQNELTQLERVIMKEKTELTQREKVITEKQTVIIEKEKIIQEKTECIERREWTEKDGEATRKEKLITDLEHKCHKLELQLKKATKELKRLQSDTHSLVEQLDEKTKLNQTLKLELSVHERLQDEGSGKHDNKSDIRELLMEMRYLRVQLEKAIDTNNNLRRTVESVLKQQADQKRASPTRDDSPTGSLTTDATDGRPSPDPHHSQSRKQSRKETHSTLSVTSEHRSETLHSNGHLLDNGAGFDLCECASNDGLPQHPSSPDKHSSSVSASSLHCCSTSPKKHLASVENIRYWFDKNPTHDDMPKVQIDTDIRQLFAIGKLDDFEKIRKENELSQSTLRGMGARVKDRIKKLRTMSASESVEYSTLRELAMSVENLNICLDEENRLLAAFWMSELPPINARGEFFDPKLASENDSLKRELVRLKSKYDFANRMIQSTEERLHATNKRRENMEHAVFKQLTKTAKVLVEANANMQRKAEDAGYSVKK